MGRDKDDEVQLRFPAKIEYLGWVHGVFSRLAEECGFDSLRKHRLLVAVTEAFTNAVIHGSTGNGRRSVSVQVTRSASEVVIRVIDNGVGLAGVPPPATWSGRELERENGRGLELMRTLADEFALSETPGGGLTVTLRYMIRENVTERLRSRAARGAGHGPKGDTMELQVETQGGVDVIHVAGRLDLVGATALKEEIRRRLQQHPQVVLNLKKVDFINSSGLGALVSILKDIRLASGRLVLSNLAPYVKEIFAITQLSNVFEIYADEEQARETFAGPVTV